MSLHVVAHLHARPGRELELKQVLEGLIRPTRAESGCLRYELHRNVEDPGEFTFLEEWRDAAALEAHFETPHLRAALDRFEQLGVTVDVRRYELLP